MSKETGGPAFPQQGATLQIKDDVYFLDKGGMTLRDYFAAACATGALADVKSKDMEISEWAKHIFALADAMLLERAKQSQ